MTEILKTISLSIGYDSHPVTSDINITLNDGDTRLRDFLMLKAQVT